MNDFCADMSIQDEKQINKMSLEATTMVTKISCSFKAYCKNVTIHLGSNLSQIRTFTQTTWSDKWREKKRGTLLK